MVPPNGIDRDNPWLQRMQLLGRAQARYLWILLLAGVFFLALHTQIAAGAGPSAVVAPLLGLELSARVVWMTGPGVLGFLILIFMGALRAYTRARDMVGLRGLDHSGEPYDTAPNALDLAAYTTPDSPRWVTNFLYFTYPAFLTLFVVEGVMIARGVASQEGALTQLLLVLGGGLLATAGGWVSWMWLHRIARLVEERRKRRWKITIPSGEFDDLRERPDFHGILNLARAVNALRFSHLAYLSSKGDDTPSGLRQRIQAFFLNCATIHETWNALEPLGQHLSHLDAWQDGIKPIQRNKEYGEFRRAVLPVMRHKFVFHFDRDLAPSALKNLNLGEYAFARAAGKAKGDVYFDLADAVALNYLLDELPEYGESEPERLAQLIKIGTRLTVDMVDAVERVLAKAALEMGWRLEGQPNGV